MDLTVLSAWKKLRIATVEGAETIGLGDFTGSLEPGKKGTSSSSTLRSPT